eukprot:CAMPEP_0203670696 /NCGR_PEP_ID=MMETSP0090-20130426/6690_1 /ASSEMBLY_ACC=CAM_ASM_001088 /TAXON_ID=426623 /ORGANISM="Chaetoceros affinis, Strain CCMP159" /LENGTH=127 /DNA_ID=CAMNT_0050535607 /DNA_START=62 /DNA_END=442 /DNA_ORIENTATION=+
MTNGKIKYKAMLSGFFAGSASCVAKYALDPSSPIPNWAQEQCLNHANDAAVAADGSINYTCLGVSLIPRAIFLLIMVGFNLLMVASFMQGMSESGTVIATALSTGTNFSVSAAYGVLLFSEKLNFIW